MTVIICPLESSVCICGVATGLSTGASCLACYNTFCKHYFATLVVASGCCGRGFLPGRERFATTTGFCCVWVLEREAATNERIAVVQLHSKHEKKAFWITHCVTKEIHDVRMGSF